MSCWPSIVCKVIKGWVTVFCPSDPVSPFYDIRFLSCNTTSPAPLSTSRDCVLLQYPVSWGGLAEASSPSPLNSLQLEGPFLQNWLNWKQIISRLLSMEQQTRVTDPGVRACQGCTCIPPKFPTWLLMSVVPCQRHFMCCCSACHVFCLENRTPYWEHCLYTNPLDGSHFPQCRNPMHTPYILWINP